MRIRFVLACLLALPLWLGAAAADAAPAVGDRAPDFHFVGDGGRDYRFEDYFRATVRRASEVTNEVTDVADEKEGAGPASQPRAGRRGVVIAWFPKAFTPG